MSDRTLRLRVYEPDREPCDVTAEEIGWLILRDAIYQEGDGQWWLRPGRVWEESVAPIQDNEEGT